MTCILQHQVSFTVNSLWTGVLRPHGLSLKHRYFRTCVHIYQNIEPVYVDLSCEGSPPVAIKNHFVVPELNTELSGTLIVKAVELYAIARLAIFFNLLLINGTKCSSISMNQREDIRYTNTRFFHSKSPYIFPSSLRGCGPFPARMLGLWLLCSSALCSAIEMPPFGASCSKNLPEAICLAQWKGLAPWLLGSPCGGIHLKPQSIWVPVGATSLVSSPLRGFRCIF